MANPKTIKLKAGEREQPFGFAHALRLLRLQEQTGRNNWKIVTKGYEFKDNEIIRSTKNTKDTD